VKRETSTSEALSDHSQ